MDRYERGRVVGRGAFGQAVLVRRKADGREFIAKEIKIQGMQPRERQEARNEILVISKLSHPNIVQYIESFEAAGHLTIIMEYADGGDLAGLIAKQHGKLMKEDFILNIFVQVL